LLTAGLSRERLRRRHQYIHCHDADSPPRPAPRAAAPHDAQIVLHLPPLFVFIPGDRPCPSIAG